MELLEIGELEYPNNPYLIREKAYIYYHLKYILLIPHQTCTWGGVMKDIIVHCIHILIKCF